jgi:hypothetical protein
MNAICPVYEMTVSKDVNTCLTLSAVDDRMSTHVSAAFNHSTPTVRLALEHNELLIWKVAHL